MAYNSVALCSSVAGETNVEKELKYKIVLCEYKVVEWSRIAAK